MPRRLAIECQQSATDRIALGSFRLSRPPRTDYHEILVGDPTHAINRISFPGAFRGADPALLQIEFAFPAAEQRPLDAEHWQRTWLESLRRLELIDARHEVALFDFKTRPLHFNGYGMEGQRLVDADPSVLRADTNVFPIVPSMANLNLNAHVAAGVEYVAGVLARGAL